MRCLGIDERYEQDGLGMKFEAEVLDVIQVTKSVLSLRFKRPEEFDYLPGQFILLGLTGGRDVTFKPLSLSSSPTEEHLEVTKRLTGHPFSNVFMGMKAGDSVQVDGPYGRFTFQGEHSKVGMLSGGVGITPLKSMMRYAIDKDLDCDIVLICSNRSEDDVVFGEDLNLMQSKNPNLRVVNTITRPGPGWTGATGRIDDAMVRKLIPDYLDRAFYTSGPQVMVSAMVSMLKGIGLQDAQIKQEVFTGYDV